MAYIIQIRRDTSTNWINANPILADGEFGYEIDTKKYKLGDGTTAWIDLPYGFTDAQSVGGYTANKLAKINNDKTIYFTLQEYTGNGSININWTQGNYAKLTLTANTTLSFTNPTGACTLNLHIFQDSVGGHTLTLPSGIVWVDNDVPSLSTAANAKATIILQWDGSEYLASYVKYQ